MLLNPLDYLLKVISTRSKIFTRVLDFKNDITIRNSFTNWITF